MLDVNILIKFVEDNFFNLVKILIFPGLGFIFGFIIFAVWYQRKYLARIMLRIGPLHCGRRLGWLQLIADAIKLLSKELIVPRAAVRSIFILVTILAPIIPATMLAFIPFAPTLTIFYVPKYNLLIVLALSTLYPVVQILKGWSANNKFTVIGAFRTIYLDLSGEIPIFISILGVILWAESFDLVEIVEKQANMWFILPQFLGFIVFFIGFLSIIEKVPFDIPTAEPEIVIGPNTEYSGALFLNNMLSDYLNILSWSMVFICLYLGGYNGPMIVWDPLLNGLMWTLIKLVIVLSLVFAIMISYPRLRLDQAIKLGWNYLLPLSIFNLFLTLVLKSTLSW